MKKYHAFLFIALFVSLLISCSKSNEVQPQISDTYQQIDLIKYYTNQFIQDKEFAKYFGQMFVNQYNMGVRRRNQDIVREQEIDSTAYYSDAAHIAIAQAQVMLIDSGYVQLSDVQLQEVMQNVVDSLSSESFRERHQDSPLVSTINQIYDDISNSGGLQTIDPSSGEGGRFGCDLSMNEIIGCVGGGLIAGAIDLAGPAKQIYRLMKGTSSWSFSEIFSFALSAVKSYVPWVKLFSVASAVAFCIIGAC
jgi:hypothetical protein